jgi:hypothetical protein
MTWRSSSYSASDGNCVQVRGDLAAVRDSKDSSGPALTADLAQLLATVKSGTLNR